MASDRVCVALSGGVDSSVATLLLKDQGIEVHTVTIRMMAFVPGSEVCCSEEGIRAAAQMAKSLGVTHEVLDCIALFESEVLEPTWLAYYDGVTPNPCVLCNQRIKFGRLLEHARERGCSRLATGHHVKIVERDGLRLLACACDSKKDQSYFLYRLNADQLSQLSFPVGEMPKEEVRRIAKERGLFVAERKESTDACFLDESCGFPETLRRHFAATTRPGDIVDTAGKVVGRHLGLHAYTIGQRRGLGVNIGCRFWVQKIDMSTNSLVVTADESTLWSKSMLVDGLHWTGRPADYQPDASFEAKVRIRSVHQPAQAEVVIVAGRALVNFKEAQRGPTPGQAAVFYDGDIVLGGGTIVSQES